MILRKFTVLLSSLFFLFLPATLFAKERGIKLHVERLALVIGNGAYQTSPLKNPINDAEDMAATLKKLGFKVILRKDADQRIMEDIIRYFGRQLKNGGVGIFYFAGHGVQVDGRNYLMPVDAKIESESDVKYEAVDAGRILGKMEDAENRLNIVILDACRNNPYASAFRSDQSGLARMDAPTGSLVAYSTAPGEVAADGPERNGIFTKYLIRHMMTPNLSIEHVLKRVRIDVARQTNGRQIPWESSSLMGDFYFNPSKTADVMHAFGSSSLAPDKKTDVAALSRTKEKNKPADSRLNLAILPIYADQSPIGSSYGSTTHVKKTAVDSLKLVLKDKKRFAPRYSFYNLGDEFNTQILDKHILTDQIMNGLWIRKNIWADTELNAELIYDLSSKIDVDFFVTYRFKYDSLAWDSRVYIIDVKNRKIAIKDDSLAIYTLHHSLTSFTEKAFSEYERDHF
jgi:hypothetical protein